MSDLRNDPNFPNDSLSQREMKYQGEARIMWVTLAVLALLVGGIMVAATFSTGDVQTASNDRPAAAETTGSGSASRGGSATPIPVQPPASR